MELVAGLIALVVFAMLACALVGPGYRDEGPVLLERMLRRHGDELARQALASGSAEFASAVRQCARCSEAARCHAWLAGDAREGYQAFCPNAGYVERMQRLAGPV